MVLTLVEVKSSLEQEIALDGLQGCLPTLVGPVCSFCFFFLVFVWFGFCCSVVAGVLGSVLCCCLVVLWLLFVGPPPPIIILFYKQNN